MPVFWVASPFVFVGGVVFLLITLVVRFARRRGVLGEWCVHAALRASLERSTVVLHDVLLPDGCGGTTQIDHVCVGQFGVVVLETKHFRGRILADANRPTWAQCLGRQKFKFQSPLRQNFKHRAVIADVLNVPVETVHGVVIFLPPATFPMGRPEGVFSLGEALGWMRKLPFSTLSPIEVGELSKRIAKVRIPNSWSNRRAHREYARRLKRASDEAKSTDQ